MYLPQSKPRLLQSSLLYGPPFVSKPSRFPNRTSITVHAICSRSVSSPSVHEQSLVESSVLPATLHRVVHHHPIISEPPLAYDLLEGSLVRHCEVNGYGVTIPTIVLVHGILGSKKNLRAFAKRLLEGFPSWQAVLVDLRCHGESYTNSNDHLGPNNVQSAARDILQLLNYLKIFPRVLIGHSFGGKVIMSMAKQFGQRLPRPVQAWVLDALPGVVRNDESFGEDHPYELIKRLQSIPLPIQSRSELIDYLVSSGFGKSIASWMTTNLAPIKGGHGFQWSFDLDGIDQMYHSYEKESLWSFLKTPPEGLKLDFVQAEFSQFRWAGTDEQDIKELGHGVHLLKNSGHWVHTDNPEGLFQIIKHSLGDTEFGLPRPTSL
eukprot:g2545.t1